MSRLNIYFLKLIKKLFLNLNIKFMITKKVNFINSNSCTLNLQLQMIKGHNF